MTAIGILKLLLLAGFGFLLLSVISRKGSRLNISSYIFFSISLSFAAGILIGSALGVAGIFSVFGIIAIEYIALFTAAALRLGRIKEKRFVLKLTKLFVFPQAEEKPGALKSILISLFIALLLFLYFNPAEYIIGGFDPGIYINSGVNLAKKGSVLFYDDVVRELGYEKARRYLGMFSINPLGLNILEQFEGRMATQFYPGFPVMYAIAYDTLGVGLFLYIQPFIALLSLFGLYLFTKHVFGRLVAALGVGLFSLNVLTVWFGRYPVAEFLTVALVSASLLLLEEFRENKNRAISITGGIILFAALLTRPDAALVLAGLFIIYYYRIITDRGIKGEGHYFIASSVGLVFSLLYAVFFTGGYLRGVFISFIGVGAKKERALMKAGIVSVIIILTVIAAIYLIRKRKDIIRYLSKFNKYYIFLPSLAGATLLSLVIFQLFIRPALPFAFLSPHDNSLIRLGWYISPLGLGWETVQNIPEPFKWFLLKGLVSLCALSAVVMVARSRNVKKWMFNLVWLPFALLYFQNLRIETTHIWLNRRYMMFILFGLIVSFIYFLNILWRLKRKARYLSRPAAAALLAIMVVSFIAGTVPIAEHREMRGLTKDISRIDNMLPENAMIILDGKEPYTLRPLHLPLMTRFGRKTATLKNSSMHIDSLPRMSNTLAGLYENVIYLSPFPDAPPRIPGYWDYVGFEEIRYKALERPDIHDYRPPERILKFTMPVHVFKYMTEQVFIERSRYLDIGGGDDYFISGEWFGKEKMGEITFRWTGPVASVLLQRDKSAEKVIIRMASGPRGKYNRPKVKITIEGGREVQFVLSEDFKEYIIPLPKPVDGLLRVDIRVKPWIPRDEGLRDVRELGILVDYLRQK